jgi:chromate transporter
MRDLARAFFAVGTQSFGGGGSTLFMLRRVVVDRSHWLSMREFTESWALSQLSPGMHLLAFAGLLGQRIAGLRGVLVSVGALMIPAALITTALTAFFGQIADQPLAVASLLGVTPVAGGMTIGMAFVTAKPMLQHGKMLIADIALVAVASAILLVDPALTVAVIVAAGAFGAVFLGKERPTSSDAPVS